ncbi:MAG: hypothetical protein ACTSR8_12520 [Promethearchaeota archaeon]
MSEEILTPEEAKILKIIKDYLRKNKPLEKKQIIPYILAHISKSDVNLNKEGIKNTLNSLLNKGIIIEGSTLTKKEIINHPKRKKIYNYIKENPAIYYYSIVKNLNFASHIVIWHLNALLDFSFISKARIDNHEIYFDSKLPLRIAKIHYFTRNEKCSQIIAQIKKSNEHGCTKTQLSKILGMHPNTVKKYIDNLEDLKILRKLKQANKNLYFLNKKFQKISHSYIF